MTPSEVALFIDYWHEAMQQTLLHDAEKKQAVARKNSNSSTL
jgi:hypothetical protein